jgi:hypothetical protein
MGIVVKRSALQELFFRFDQKLPARTDARWRLGREREVELFEQDFLIGLWMGVATQDQGATVGRREVHIEHLNGGQFVQNRTWGQSGCERKQTGSQGHVQAIVTTSIHVDYTLFDETEKKVDWWTIAPTIARANGR